MAEREAFEVFSRRILAGATQIEIHRGGQHTTLDKLSLRDRLAHVDRWYADGVDPLQPLAAPGPAPKVSEDRPELDVFFGWVQRALHPGPGYEWARVELPRHVVEAMAKPDAQGRTLRRDAREVMTQEVLGELARWDLGNREPPMCVHRYWLNPTGAPGGRVECIDCGKAKG